MELKIKAKVLQVKEETDVLIVGGGPAGLGAAVAAARQGSKVILLEKRGFLGGNITASYVETCNHFLYGTDIKPSGIYAEIEEKYKERFGKSGDLRENSPHRFSSEYLKIFLDDFMKSEGVHVKFHSFVNEVVVEDGKIQGVIIQSKKGPIAIKAGMVIDSTGDGDVAFSAGVPFAQGRDKDGLCQPGTLNFRIAGIDADKLTEGGDQLKAVMKEFHADYRKGITGLSCKRQDIPFGRLTKGGQLSYVNYPCAYEIDPTDVDGLTQGEIECRQYILEICDYMKEHFTGMSGIELASIAPEIGFRDSRRIEGLYELTEHDIEANKEFEDAIAIYPRIYDMLAPDGSMAGDGKMEGHGYEGHIYVPVENNRTFRIPYRCLIPKNIDNLLVSGRCISANHVAESSIRGISACTLTGQAAGTAAALANKYQIKPSEVNIKELQSILKAAGVELPDNI